MSTKGQSVVCSQFKKLRNKWSTVSLSVSQVIQQTSPFLHYLRRCFFSTFRQVAALLPLCPKGLSIILWCGRLAVPPSAHRSIGSLAINYPSLSLSLSWWSSLLWHSYSKFDRPSFFVMLQAFDCRSCANIIVSINRHPPHHLGCTLGNPPTFGLSCRCRMSPCRFCGPKCRHGDMSGRHCKLSARHVGNIARNVAFFWRQFIVSVVVLPTFIAKKMINIKLVRTKAKWNPSSLFFDTIIYSLLDRYKRNNIMKELIKNIMRLKSLEYFVCRQRQIWVRPLCCTAFGVCSLLFTIMPRLQQRLTTS